MLCLMLCFYSCGEKMSKKIKGYDLNNDYLGELCVSQVLGQLSSSFSVIRTVKRIVSDVLKSDLLIS